MWNVNTTRPLLLDTFCKAGGATRGYQLAGFYVVGVDIEPQPHYIGDEFFELDALEFIRRFGKEFDVIHASPPCQAYTRMNKGLLLSLGTAREYPDLIAPTRKFLIASGRDYVIENVPGAPLLNPIQLCGSSFNLPIQRHRLFESNCFLLGLPCAHKAQKADKPYLTRATKEKFSRVVGIYGNGRGAGDNIAAWKKAMQIDWMTRKELSQAIPPAYTEFIGRQFMQIIKKGCPNVI